MGDGEKEDWGNGIFSPHKSLSSADTAILPEVATSLGILPSLQMKGGWEEMSFPLRTFPNPFCQAQPTSSFHLPSASTMPCMASDTLGLMCLSLPPLGSPYWGSEGWGQRQHLPLCCACELCPFALHKGHW